MLLISLILSSISNSSVEMITNSSRVCKVLLSCAQLVQFIKLTGIGIQLLNDINNAETLIKELIHNFIYDLHVATVAAHGEAPFDSCLNFFPFTFMIKIQLYFIGILMLELFKL